MGLIVVGAGVEVIGMLLVAVDDIIVDVGAVVVVGVVVVVVDAGVEVIGVVLSVVDDVIGDVGAVEVIGMVVVVGLEVVVMGSESLLAIT